MIINIYFNSITKLLKKKVKWHETEGHVSEVVGDGCFLIILLLKFRVTYPKEQATWYNEYIPNIKPISLNLNQKVENSLYITDKWQ